MQDLKILTIGAGIAGLTLAALLKKQGLITDIIEKESEEHFNASGYMLGLLPLGGRVLTALDADEEYFGKSVEMKYYEIHKENGELNKAYPLDFINLDFGSYRGIERKVLIDLLLDKTDQTRIRYGTTAKEIKQTGNQVKVDFSDGTRQKYDLVIAADGIHSDTRQLLYSEDEYSFYDTHWGGWVAWLENREMDRYKEYWGASAFMGLYSVKSRIGVFLGGPDELIREKGVRKFIREIKEEIEAEKEILHPALDAILEDENPYYWEFHDCRTEQWSKGNVILLGDAACGFLPTAGVGASMAMDSAAALVDELSRTDRQHIEYGLKLFVKRQQERVEIAQKDSRNLGKIMFVKSGIIAGIRDYAIRFYTLRQLASGITKTMEG